MLGRHAEMIWVSIATQRSCIIVFLHSSKHDKNEVYQKFVAINEDFLHTQKKIVARIYLKCCKDQTIPISLLAA
jgi:hypothetical protein